MKFHPKDNTVPLAIRFWSRVNKLGPVHPIHGRCWVWTGPLMPNGYGQLSVKARSEYAHRCSYMIHNGSIPESLQVLHKCDNPACVRPAHLFVGTCKDNRQDSVKKDRHARGERQWIAVLTDDAVKEIRRRYKKKCRRNGATALGRDFGVSGATVWDAVMRKTWKHIK